MKHTLVVCFFLTAAVSTVWGQASAGLVVVTVQDPSGAAVAGATVTLTEEATAAVTTQTAGNDGLARFVSVKPSMYSVSAGHEGFKKTSRQNVTVNVAESVTLL